MFNKSTTDIIRSRFSCRTYQERPIAEETQARLEEYLASPHEGPFGNSPRFKLVAAAEGDSKALRGLGTYGFIKNPTGFIIGATREGEKSLEDFGYLMEEIILWATALGLGTCWLGGTFNRSRFAQKISLEEGEIIPAAISVGYCAKQPARVDKVVRDAAKGDRRFPWDKLFFKGRFGIPLGRDEAGDYATPLEMLRLGPSASNRQPWRVIKEGKVWHFYLQRTKGYPGRVFNVLLRLADLQRVDMGIAMSHFGLTAEELGLEGAWAMDEPDIEKTDELTEYVVSWRT